MKTVIKPWGKEVWLELNDRYCYKRIYINAGYKTSYQYHNFKIETNYIISGEAEVWLENDEGIVEKKLMKEGDYFNVKPPKKHRVIALTDIILQEVSTPEVDDVFRINDEFARGDGKVEGEHKTPAVLILATGLGTRLGNLTKNINKALLPINNKAIISHIIEKFPREYDFIITKGYKGDTIEEYCKLAHPNHKFTFVEVDNIDGEGSGPGYSTLKCESLLQRPFYLTTCDCLIDSKVPFLDGNWLGVYPTSYPEKYSTVGVDDNENIVSFLNKSDKGHDLAFIGLAGVWDYDVFWKELQDNIKSGELVNAFFNPKNYPTFKVKKINWFDTGNFDDLNKAKEYFNDRPLSLYKENSEITYKVDETFLKFSPDTNHIKNKSTRADILKDLTPTNFKSKNNFISYDWQPGKTLYEYDDITLYNKFLDEFKNNLNETIDGVRESLKSFYLTKTEGRLNLFLKKHSESYLESEFEINGVAYPSMKTTLDSIDFESLYSNKFYKLFHGDLQFDNVVYNPSNDKFSYIDWRDSFSDTVDSGDVYYDLSKLYGGLIIPYNIMKDESNIEFSQGNYSVKYNYPVSSNLVKFKRTYEKWIIDNGYDLEKIKLITGIIFLNMSPLHDEKFGKMLWYKSIEMLNDYNK